MQESVIPDRHQRLEYNYSIDVLDIFKVSNTITLKDFSSMPSSGFNLRSIPARTRHAAAIIHMILNNLDPCVAQFPQELVTYGGNGQVFSNWAQVRYYAF